MAKRPGAETPKPLLTSNEYVLAMAEETVFYSGPLVTLADAKALALPRYYTAAPCKRGHIDERRTSTRVCVTCSREANQAIPKEIKRARNKQWFAENPEKARDLRKRQYERNKPKRQESARIRIAKARETNREHVREVHRRHVKKHPEKRAELKRTYRENNPEKVAAQCKAAIAKNPEKYLAFRRNRRALVKGAEGTHTAEDILWLHKKQKGKCAICGKPYGKSRHVDHIIALINGGANDRKNLQLTHVKCNLSKGPKDPIAFMQSRGYLL